MHSRVSAAPYQEETRSWDVTLGDGRRYSTRLLITAIGVLSARTIPRTPGVKAFTGQSCHTAHWPKESVNFAGERVAVIGTRAIAVQTIAKDVGHLTVFQCTANWCAALHNSTISAEEMRQIGLTIPRFLRAATRPRAVSSTARTRALPSE